MPQPRTTRPLMRLASASAGQTDAQTPICVLSVGTWTVATGGVLAGGGRTVSGLTTDPSDGCAAAAATAPASAANIITPILLGGSRSLRFSHSGQPTSKPRAPPRRGVEPGLCRSLARVDGELADRRRVGGAGDRKALVALIGGDGQVQRWRGRA